MNAFWLTWLGVIVVGFGVAEGHALTTKVQGDTLSERTRAWFKTSTPGGGWTFAGVWTALLVTWGWYLGHILGWWS